MHITPRFSAVFVIPDLPKDEFQKLSKGKNPYNSNNEATAYAQEDGTVTIFTDYSATQHKANYNLLWNLFYNLQSTNQFISSKTFQTLLDNAAQAIKRLGPEDTRPVSISALPATLNANPDKNP